MEAKQGNGTNGTAAAGLPAEAGEQAAKVDPATAASKARAVIDAQIRQALGVTFRGLLVSAPGVPPHELLHSIARVSGALLAESIMADLPAHFAARKAFQEQFAEGIKKAPMNQVPTATPHAMTAFPR